jgi:UDP-2,3-diacylglucosamine hydrolase
MLSALFVKNRHARSVNRMKKLPNTDSYNPMPMSAAMSIPSKLGIIAGGGDAPKRLLTMLDGAGRDYVLICLQGQADADLPAGRPHTWLPLGAAGRARDVLRHAGASDVIMLGRVRRPSLSELRPDWLTLQKLPQIGLSMLGDDGVLRGISRAFESEGFRILGVQDIVQDFITPAGLLTKATINQAAQQDIRIGIAAAKKLGTADLGQAVVVRQGVVIAEETVDGTDAMLRRASAGGVLVKCCKPQQDKRLDLPTIGLNTVKLAVTIGLQGIAVEAGQSLFFDRAAALAAADQAGLFILGIDAASIAAELS